MDKVGATESREIDRQVFSNNSIFHRSCNRTVKWGVQSILQHHTCLLNTLSLFPLEVTQSSSTRALSSLPAISSCIQVPYGIYIEILVVHRYYIDMWLWASHKVDSWFWTLVAAVPRSHEHFLQILAVRNNSQHTSVRHVYACSVPPQRYAQQLPDEQASKGTATTVPGDRIGTDINGSCLEVQPRAYYTKNMGGSIHGLIESPSATLFGPWNNTCKWPRNDYT